MQGAAPDDSTFEPSAFERLIEGRPRRRWMGWRVRLLVLAALLGCIAQFALMRSLAGQVHIDAIWSTGPRGQLLLQATPLPDLQSQVGTALYSASSRGREPIRVDAALFAQSARWLVWDEQRAEHVRRSEALAEVLRAERVSLHFADGSTASVTPTRRGFSGLPMLFWLLSGLALVVYLVGVVVVMARPRTTNLLYAVMALCQAATLVWLGVDTIDDIGTTLLPAIDSLPWRIALDLTTAAAAVQVFALQPMKLPGHRLIGGAAWAIAGVVVVLALLGQLPHLWWWGQGMTLALGAAAIGVLSHSYRREPNPFAAVLRRFGIAALGTMVLVSAAVAAAWWQSGVPYGVATAAALIWYVFFASLLLLVPFLSRARRVLREFAMLAGLSTVATSLDLLFVSVFSLGQFTSLTLAVFIALAAYAAARQWVLNQMLGSSLVTTERTFDQLYRVAREVQQHPERLRTLLAQLLRDLFDPMEVVQVDRASARARVVADGAALVVPLHGPGSGADTRSLVLRFARRGQRIFTEEDARLADRIVDQLRRAVAYDQAVERGRTEERLRLAQDLHDDIGARLLTLMYKAQTQEVEDYVRHTLQDLKTLTRGLAAAEHRLSHAAAEWKADLHQRLTAAHVHLSWSFRFDHDVRLSVVQWSSLTRILRELVSNIIHHAQATRVDIVGQLAGPRLTLRIEDDGVGRHPAAWSHGLGLGGVRKRVKLLGGTVQWRERGERGIVCEVEVPQLSAPET